MPTHDQLSELLAAWEAAFRGGKDPKPEQLAPSVPELWDALRQSITLRRNSLAVNSPDTRTVDPSSAFSEAMFAEVAPRPPEHEELLKRLRPPEKPDELGRLGEYRLLKL